MTDYKFKRQPPSRVREAAVEHKARADGEPARVPGVYHVTVTDRGRLVLPADVRDTLKIRDGDRVSLTLEDDGRLVLQTRDVAIGRLRGMFKPLATPGRRASDELVAERRREARMEDRKFREWDRRLRKAGK